jgi:hypothetical protein
MRVEGEHWLPKSKDLVKDLKIDPTITSIIPPASADIEQTEQNNSVHHGKFADSSGREYYRILQGPPQDQMLLARLLKGILPVSEVVYLSNVPEQIDPKGRLFVSYKMPLGDIGSSQDQYGAAEVQQDIDLLHLIFADRDHTLYENEKPGSEHNNLRSKDGRTVFFDFGDAFRIPDEYGFWGYDEQEKYNQLRTAMMHRRKTLTEQEHIPFLRERVEMLHKSLTGEHGHAFVQAIVSDIERRGTEVPRVIRTAPGKSTEEKVLAFQNEIEKRIEALRAGLNDPLDDESLDAA